MINRAKLDTWRRLTYIDIQNVFPSDGAVHSIELNVGAAGVNRPLKVGIYEKLAGDCQFRLLGMVRLSDFQSGDNTVSKHTTESQYV